MRQPTIKDVAARAGVSKSLVSRVMQGAATVSEARRRAVLEAAAELGYRPNAAARSLVRQRSHAVGVLVSDLHNPFFAEVLDGIHGPASRAGFRVLVVTGNRDPAAEARALQGLLELRADGVILVSPRLPASTIAAAARSVPTVAVARRVTASALDNVTSDDARGAQLAVDHLVGLGHRRIALVDGGDGAGAEDRRRGYEAAMAAHGLAAEIRVAAGDFTEEGGARGIEALLAERPGPTAVCAANDLAALGALDALEARGLAVPRDVSLVGYDNTALAALRHIDLTTVDQPRRAMGEAAAAALLDRLDGVHLRGRHVVLEPTLVVRGTTRSPT